MLLDDDKNQNEEEEEDGNERQNTKLTLAPSKSEIASNFNNQNAIKNSA